jgi:hypothetical protein
MADELVPDGAAVGEAPVEGAPGVEAPPAEAGPSLDDVLARMDQMGQQLQSLQPTAPSEPQQPADPLQQLLNGGEGEAPQQEVPRDLRDAFDEDPEGFVNALREATRSEFRQELAPVFDHIRSQGLNALEEEFPALGTEEGADKLMGAAEAAAQQIGNPALVQQPDFLRMVHLAQLGEQAAAGETPAGGQQQVSLETGGGAPPEPQQRNVFEQIAGQQQDAGKAFWTG